MIVTKLGELNFPGVAVKLLKNKEEVIQYLIKNEWTPADMTSQWEAGEFDNHVLGKETDGLGLLRNTKGVMIYPCRVYIAHFNEDGGVTKPFIKCNAKKFKICE